MATYTRQAFVKAYTPLAIKLTKGTGIFPEVLLARAIIESQGPVNGTYLVGASTLSRKANNYFGIKADSSWKGNTITLPTGEYNKAGQRYVINDKFRAYNSLEESMADFVKFLQQNKRYANAGLFTAPTIAEQNLRLYKAGYFTDPSGSKLSTSVADSIKNWVIDAAKDLDIIKNEVEKGSKKHPIVTVGLFALAAYAAHKIFN